MALNIKKELAVMERKSVRELREVYEDVFGEACRSNHKQWIIKRVAWRMQANVEGDLSERARKRAEELAKDADLRMKSPVNRSPAEPQTGMRRVTGKITSSHDRRLPMPGTVLIRDYKGEEIQVMVLPNAFEYHGETFKFLTAVARAVTGLHCNGFRFFNLTDKKASK
ncbi:hypothetical protein Pla110_23640 [Polystyrenella longa]|uniref:DUF2924 domain-containing protein n=1 Tax=Polystyrenella longa TaxID=2528007 RepID=A0A518CN54_9PLAN|nr:DUF2924 domain-containing protein [Polystyrenella longa]QDU80633.1 hypothetical protein Pla110_23640 [Polystyrenella longa]